MDFKTDGKNLKNFMTEEKPEKQSISHTLRKFRRACENPKYHFAKGVKILHTLRKPNRTLYENFARHAKFSHPQLCKKLCEIRQGVRTHFATLEKFCKLYANSNSLCENQRSLKNLFEPFQALFSFHTPHLPIVKASITLRRPSFHSFFSIGHPAPTHLKRRPTLNLWNTNPSLSLHF